MSKAAAPKKSPKNTTKAPVARAKSAPKSVAKTTGKTAKSAPSRAAKKGEAEVTLDRRRVGRREEAEVAVAPAAPAPKLERREKVNRRRQIDPTTCERDYSLDEVEFMNVAGRRTSGRTAGCSPRAAKCWK